MIIKAHELREHAEFTAARAALKQSPPLYEEALEQLVALIEKMSKAHGEESEQCASAWFEYGSTLLAKEEENPSHGLLGDAATKAVEAQAEAEGEDGDEEGVGKADAADKNAADEEGGGEEEEEEEEEGEEVDDDAEEGEQEDVDDADDLQVAFESLETSRRMYEGCDPSESVDEKLAQIRMRIGDLKRFNNDEAGAIEEYQEALDIRLVICESHERDLADTHYAMAQANVYLANEEGLADPMGAKKTALTHYMKCVDSLKAYLLESGKQGENMMEHQPHPNCVCKTCTEEVSELEKEMQECVDALRDEIQHEQNNGNNGAVSSGAAGVTTIGFGNPTAGASSSSSPSLSSSSSSPRPGGLAGAVPNVFNFSFPQATATAPVKINIVPTKSRGSGARTANANASAATAGGSSSSSSSSTSSSSAFPGRDVTNLGSKLPSNLGNQNSGNSVKEGESNTSNTLGKREGQPAVASAFSVPMQVKKKVKPTPA